MNTNEAPVIKNRLIQYLKSKRIKLAQLEKKAGLANAYLRNTNGAIGATKLRDILLVCPDLDANWLLTGEGHMLKSNGQEIQNVNGQNAKAVYKGNMTVNEKEELEPIPRITIQNIEGIDSSTLPDGLANFIDEVKELKNESVSLESALKSLKEKYETLLEKYEEKSESLDKAKDELIKVYREQAENNKYQ